VVQKFHLASFQEQCRQEKEVGKDSDQVGQGEGPTQIPTEEVDGVGREASSYVLLSVTDVGMDVGGESDDSDSSDNVEIKIL
jgi:hypothetical protein